MCQIDCSHHNQADNHQCQSAWGGTLARTGTAVRTLVHTGTAVLVACRDDFNFRGTTLSVDQIGGLDASKASRQFRCTASTGWLNTIINTVLIIGTSIINYIPGLKQNRAINTLIPCSICYLTL